MKKHKIKIGIALFFAGLALYMLMLSLDYLRGEVNGRMGLYQYVGVLIGYILSGIGLVLLVKSSDETKAIGNILRIGGAMILLIALFADQAGIGDAPGLDKFQVIGMAIGVAISLSGFILPIFF